MTSNIEHKVQALTGLPINEDISSDHRQYKHWFVANFGEYIADNTLSENRECQNHIDQIARLSDSSYGTAVFEIKDAYISFLHARAERLSDIVQDSLTGQFVSYSASSKAYLDILTQAVDDHLGTTPESITKDDIECMEHVYLNLQEAHGYVQGYGYNLKPPSSE